MPLLSDTQKQKFRFNNPIIQDYVKKAKKNVSVLNNVFKKMSRRESNEDFRITESIFSLDREGVLLSGVYFIGNVDKAILRMDITANYKKSVVEITFSPYIIINNKQQYIRELFDNVVKFEMLPEKNEPCLFTQQGDKSDIEYKHYLEKEFGAFYRKVTSIVKEKYSLLIEYSEKEEFKNENRVMRELKRSRKLESVSSSLSKEECCEYILNYINSIREYVKDIDANLQWLKQTSWDDEDYSKINSFIKEDKDDIYSKLKDIEFCLKKI